MWKRLKCFFWGGHKPTKMIQKGHLTLVSICRRCERRYP